MSDACISSLKVYSENIRVAHPTLVLTLDDIACIKVEINVSGRNFSIGLISHRYYTLRF
jgi:hypothetical protein